MKIRDEKRISCLAEHDFEPSKIEFRIQCTEILHQHIPCGLVARIRRFHRRGRGSIPRKGVPCFSRIHNAINKSQLMLEGNIFLIVDSNMVYIGIVRISDHRRRNCRFSRFEKRPLYTHNILLQLSIPCGLVARIRRSHRRGRGSIPRTGVCLVMTQKNANSHSFLQ